MINVDSVGYSEKIRTRDLQAGDEIYSFVSQNDMKAQLTYHHLMLFYVGERCRAQNL